MKQAVIDGARIAYVDEGSGPPVLLLHGYPQSHLAWRHQIEALSRRRRVIAPDWIGWGESDRPLDLAYDFDTEVGRVGAFLDAIGLERVDLVGHDYGGLLSLGFVVRHPSRVGRLAILNSRAHRSFPGIYYWATALVCALARSSLLRGLLLVSPLHGIHRRGLRSFERRGCFDAELADSYVGFLRGPERRWWVRLFADYEVRPRTELASRLGQIRSRTVIVWGTEDAWCPIEIAESLADGIPGSKLVRVEGADHFVMEERPGEVTAALEELLED